MASIGTDKRGNRYIQFEDRHRQRRTIRLGRVTQRVAEATRLRVEKLVAAQLVDAAPDAETMRWVAEVGDRIADKLAKVGLIDRRHSGTLGEFLKEYLATRTDVKPGTRKAWAATHKSLRDYFGDRRPLRSITPGEAEAWRRSIAAGRADNTVRKRTAIAKTLFNTARKFRLIDHNPFDGLPSSMVENKARMHFVSRDVAQKVLDACPSAEWRTIFALARYGGLRCPSEVMGLRWSDVLWDRDRFTVRSPKTEHHAGKESRVVPIFPELRPYLNESWDALGDGPAEFVVTRIAHSGVNLRTQLGRIIKAAGVKPWPKLFQNLRSTRETELANEFPIHVVCEWIGNSRPVAMKHYLQTTDDHFADAAGRKSAANALQNGAASPCSEAQSHQETREKTKAPGIPRLSMGDTGFEPVTSAV